MRGTSNANVRGNSRDRRSRREYLARAFESDWGEGTCRCYRCGLVLALDSGIFRITVDRIVPGAKGGRYVRSNIRPACARCNSEAGGSVRSDTASTQR